MRLGRICPAIDSAASGGTIFPIASRHRASELPDNVSGVPSGNVSGRLCSAASSSVVSGLCQVPSSATIIHVPDSVSVGMRGSEIAAGLLIIQEAGGTVTDFEGGRPLPWEKGNIVGSNGKIGRILVEQYLN